MEVRHTHLSTDVVEQRAEYLCLHRQDVWRVSLVEPVPHELLEECFGRSGWAKVECDGLDGYDRTTCHGDIFVVVEECTARRHHLRAKEEERLSDQEGEMRDPVLGFKRHETDDLVLVWKAPP
jgi:hypothetical protein